MTKKPLINPPYESLEVLLFEERFPEEKDIPLVYLPELFHRASGLIIPYYEPKKNFVVLKNFFPLSALEGHLKEEGLILIFTFALPAKYGYCVYAPAAQEEGQQEYIPETEAYQRLIRFCDKYRNIGDSLYAQGKTEEALEAYDLCARVSQNPEDLALVHLLETKKELKEGLLDQISTSKRIFKITLEQARVHLNQLRSSPTLK